MPIYMRIDTIQGPITYDGTKGWLEVRSCQTNVKSDQKGKASGGKVIVTRSADALSAQLFHLNAQATMTDVEIVFVDPDPWGDLPTRIKLSEAILARYQHEADLDTLTFNAGQITYVTGSPGQASSVVGLKDWATRQAAALFGGSGKP
jgi:hypothetical protein